MVGQTGAGGQRNYRYVFTAFCESRSGFLILDFQENFVFGDNAVHNSNVTRQGDGRKAASHPEGSGLTFSPVLKRLFEQ